MGNYNNHGALYAARNGSNSVELHGGGEARCNLYFDASKSNEIYGKSDKVLPESFALIAQIKY